MKDRKKRVAFLALLIFTIMLCGVTASAGFRKKKDPTDGKYYYYYYTSKNTYIHGVKGSGDYRQWQFKNIRSNGSVYTYCFDADGHMLTGWKKLTTKSAKGTYYWYYFDRNGRMYKNRTKNGHYLQKNGRMLTNNWHGGIYYGEDGAAIANYQQDVKSGFKKSKKGTKYKKADGTYAAKEWLCIKDSRGKYYWYYFYSSGYMAKKTWVGDHYVDAHGRWLANRTKK